MPTISMVDNEEKEQSESWEDLRDDEYEENLDEYGDGNQEAGWSDNEEEDENLESYEDEEDEDEI